MMTVCASWQGFLQQVVYQVGRGYVCHCVVCYPGNKQDKWLKTDEKLRRKYDCGIDKFKRARRKRQGLANYVFLRYGATGVILRSPGAFDQERECGDVFAALDTSPLLLPVGSLVFRVGRGSQDRGVTVTLSKESFRGLKAHLEDVARLKQRQRLLDEWSKIINLPAWRGIVDQLRLLRDYVIKEARRHGVRLSRKDLPVRFRRKIYPVFTEGRSE